MPLAGKYRNAARRCQLLLREKVDSLLALMCPYRCALCDGAARSMDLCAGCRLDLPWLTRSCRLCALPLATTGLCAQCLACPPAHSACHVALIYEYPVNRMVTALKFSGRSYMARIMGELLTLHLDQRMTAATRPDQVMPVPLHLRRWSERGYNQAELIAAAVANRLRLSLATDVLRRNRPTATQTGLGRDQRLKNLRAAFTVHADLTGQRIALVDDVITTGATVAACVAGLQQAGAADVQVWAVARTTKTFRKYS